MNFLIIDDSDDARELLSFLLKMDFPESIRVLAHSGNEGITFLKRFSEKIQVIICDYRMPDGDGLSVFKAWQQSYSHIPFILYSPDALRVKGEFLSHSHRDHRNLFFYDKTEGIDGFMDLMKKLMTGSEEQLPLA